MNELSFSLFHVFRGSMRRVRLRLNPHHCPDIYVCMSIGWDVKWCSCQNNNPPRTLKIDSQMFEKGWVNEHLSEKFQHWPHLDFSNHRYISEIQSIWRKTPINQLIDWPFGVYAISALFQPYNSDSINLYNFKKKRILFKTKIFKRENFCPGNKRTNTKRITTVFSGRKHVANIKVNLSLRQT